MQYFIILCSTISLELLGRWHLAFWFIEVDLNHKLHVMSLILLKILNLKCCCTCYKWWTCWALCELKI
jgi:hypothetical protein